MPLTNRANAKFKGLNALFSGRRAGGGGAPPPVPADYIITNDAEWASTMALGAATLNNKTAEVRGALGSVTLSGLNWATGFTVRGGPGGSIRRLFMTGTLGPLRLESLSFQMTGWPRLHDSCIYFDGGTFPSTTIDGCTIRHGYGAGLADFDTTANYPEYDRVSNVRTATTVSATYALTWKDAARNEGWIEFFNRGAATVHVVVGGSGVTATLGSPACAAGQRLRISGLNPQNDTHFAVIAASGSQEVNARTEIGLAAYVADGFASSGSANIGILDIRRTLISDTGSAFKLGARPDRVVAQDNRIRRVYMDALAAIPKLANAGFFNRNLIDVAFSRSGIAENLNGDARDPHGDTLQMFANPSTGAIEGVRSAGNRVLRPPMRAGVTNQGIFWSDNDSSPSYRNVASVSDLLIGGATNGISSGEPGFPVDGFFIFGATVIHGGDITENSTIRIEDVTPTGGTYIGSSVAAGLTLGANVAVDGVTNLIDATDPSLFFANFGGVPTATTRAQIEAALATVGAAAGRGAVAHADKIDWTTETPENVIRWNLLPSGVHWPDQSDVAVNTLITLPLRRILNRNTGQAVTVGPSTEWRKVAADGTTELQAWGSSAGSVDFGQHVQIRRQSSPLSLTAVQASITINGYARTVTLTTESTAAKFNTSTSGPRFEADHNVPAGTSAVTISARLRLNMTGGPFAGVRWLTHFGATSFVFGIQFDGSVQLGVWDGAGAVVHALAGIPGVTVPTNNTFFTIIVRPDLAAAVTKITVNGVTTDVLMSAAGTPTFQTASNRRANLLAVRTTGVAQLAAEVEYLRLWYSGVASGLEPGVAPFDAIVGPASAANAKVSPFLKQGSDAT